MTSYAHISHSEEKSTDIFLAVRMLPSLQTPAGYHTADFTVYASSVVL
jgi:hypothetical protein